MALTEEQKQSRLTALHALEGAARGSQSKFFIEELIRGTENGKEDPVNDAKADTQALLALKSDAQREAYRAARIVGKNATDATSTAKEIVPDPKKMDPKK